MKEYRDYIKSPAWQQTRTRIRKVQRPQFCYCCGRSRVLLELHHKTYESLGREISMHMCFVCRSCHQEIHDYAKERATDLWHATKRVRQRNGGLVAYKASMKAVIKAAATLPTLEDLNVARYSKAQLAEWGIAWPPQKGWKKKLEKQIRALKVL